MGVKPSAFKPCPSENQTEYEPHSFCNSHKHKQVWKLHGFKKARHSCWVISFLASIYNAYLQVGQCIFALSKNFVTVHLHTSHPVVFSQALGEIRHGNEIKNKMTQLYFIQDSMPSLMLKSTPHSSAWGEVYVYIPTQSNILNKKAVCQAVLYLPCLDNYSYTVLTCN